MRLRIVVALGLLFGTGGARSRKMWAMCRSVRSAIRKRASTMLMRSARNVMPSRRSRRQIQKRQRFKDVANTPGMTATAIRVWLQGASHPTMPNFVIEGRELRNLTAYMLSLKD